MAASGAAADPAALASAPRQSRRPRGEPPPARGVPRAAERQQPAGSVPPVLELIQPSVSERSRAVRTNARCTVRGCGKILPDSTALRTHLVKQEPPPAAHM